MIPKFYILKDNGLEQVKQFITPEPIEVRDAKSQMKWGMKEGIISLVNPIRTTMVYWEV